MANRPASAGAHSAGAHSAGPQRGPAAAPPPVHHQGFPRSPRTAPARPAALAWLPYLIVLAGVAVGLFVIWQGSQYAGPGAGLVGGALLVAAVTRLVLPPRYAGLLASRGRALDVATYAVLGAAVLGVALSLP
jgi:Protein of unknown function (DUF3017)